MYYLAMIAYLSACGLAFLCRADKHPLSLFWNNTCKPSYLTVVFTACVVADYRNNVRLALPTIRSPAFTTLLHCAYFNSFRRCKKVRSRQSVSSAAPCMQYRYNFAPCLHPPPIRLR